MNDTIYDSIKLKSNRDTLYFTLENEFLIGSVNRIYHAESFDKDKCFVIQRENVLWLLHKIFDHIFNRRKSFEYANLFFMQINEMNFVLRIGKKDINLTKTQVYLLIDFLIKSVIF